MGERASGFARVLSASCHCSWTLLGVAFIHEWMRCCRRESEDRDGRARYHFPRERRSRVLYCERYTSEVNTFNKACEKWAAWPTIWFCRVGLCVDACSSQLLAFALVDTYSITAHVRRHKGRARVFAYQISGALIDNKEAVILGRVA